MSHGEGTPPDDAPARAVPDGGRRRRFGSPALWLVIVAAIALGVTIYLGLQDRRGAGAALQRTTEDAAIPVVSVTRPAAGAPTDELVLPGTTRAYTDAAIYARTSGYLKRWLVDIGTRVKQGQLLAEIETPEIDQQLHQARAQLDTAQANLDLAKTTAARWQTLLKTQSVSQQETDEKLGDLSAKAAMVESNAANVRRLEDLQGFQRIYAPFDGVITARNTDIGALIEAGATAQARELFRLAAIDKLRVYVGVPQTQSQAAQPGTPVTITLEELPGKVFRGVLARTANAIDPVQRTLLSEVEIENPTGELLPGAYVVVHLRLARPTRGVTVPANALMFRAQGLQVAVVRNGRAELVSVTMGRDYGKSVEIVAGLSATDTIILDPVDSLTSGTPVRISEKPAPPSGR